MALGQVGIPEELYQKSPFELSGGQKKRVAIAGVLAMNPKILILDEPTAGLDPQGRDEILNQIAELHEKRGITIVLVSHSMEDIARQYATKLPADEPRPGPTHKSNSDSAVWTRSCMNKK